MDGRDKRPALQSPDTRHHDAGPPGTGKSHLATALGVEAVKAGRSVYFASLADIVGALAKAEREGQLRERIRFLCRPLLLIVDEIGYLPVIAGGGNLFFQLVNARYERGAMILTSNRGFAELIGCFTTLWSSRLTDQATGCGSMPISCQSTSAPGPASTRQFRHSRRATAVGHPKTEATITIQPADHRTLFTAGVGYQVAVSPNFNPSPLTPAYSNARVFTTRFNF